MIKPDGVQRKLVGEIIKRFENAYLKLEKIEMLTLNEKKIEELYSGLENRKYDIEINGKKQILDGKKVQSWLKYYISKGPIVAMVWSGENSVEIVRKTIGHKNPVLAKKGTIRGDFGKDDENKSSAENRACRNIVHASETEEDAEKEIKTIFG